MRYNIGNCGGWIMKKILIVGGGSSGLVAAASLAKLVHEYELDAKIILIEQKEKLGKKLLATGNGRCNMSNINMDITYYHGHHISLIEDLIKQFDVQDFFEEIGLWTKVMGSLIYPFSEQASSVVNILKQQLDLYHVEVHLEEKVDRIIKNKYFNVKTNLTNYQVDYVILATGADVASQFGSDGSGFELLKSFHHKIFPTYPSLVQVKCQDANPKLKGVRIHGTFSLYVDDCLMKQEKGEILFTEDGLSGISILQLSRYFYLYPHQKVEISIDALDQFDEQTLRYKLKKLIDLNSPHLLEGIVNQKYAQFLESKLQGQLSYKTISQLIKLLKDCRFTITGTRDKKSAQVASGGASLEMFDIETFESKKVSGLYAIGELLDVDGDCGGYNLHFAFLSGECVAKSIFNQLFESECF